MLSLFGAQNYEQAGFYPIDVNAEVEQTIDLMLLSKDAEFNFTGARWATLEQTHPWLTQLFARGAETPAEAQQRYQQLMDNEPNALASLLNLTTAMSQISLPQGTPLQYLQKMNWSNEAIKPDRFFAYADIKLLDQVKLATAHGEFAPEPLPQLFHPGATVSYKQVQFGEANLQLTFHEEDAPVINGVQCVKVEADIDYYKDQLAHALLEVIPNHFEGPTDPKAAYVLRWIAGRHAGVPEFEPPYTIE